MKDTEKMPPIGKHLINGMQRGAFVSFALILMPASVSADTRSWFQQIVEAGEIGDGYSHGQYPSVKGYTHPGIDIGGGCGLPVKAAADGTVVRVITEGDDKDFQSLGNAVVIQHKDESAGRPTYTLYLHMMNTPVVSTGPVFKGDLLGHTGQTGFAEGCHLHFEVRHFEGIRNVYNPTEGNIYVKGDRSGPGDLEPDWSDPEMWVRRQESQRDAQRATAQIGGTLRRGIGGKVDTVDPHRSSADWEDIVMGDMFVGLVDKDASGRLIPGVARNWTQDSAGLVWTFNLRRNATWSDGVALTAHDFVYGFQRLQDPETASQWASLFWMIKNAERVNAEEIKSNEIGVRAIDDHTLEIVLNEPTPYLLDVLSKSSAYPVPRHIVKKHGYAWIHPDNIAVNGPYKLVYWKTGDQLVATKNPNFWDAASICYDKVAYFEFEDIALMEKAVTAGRIDIASDFQLERTQWLRRNLPGWVRTSPNLHLTYWVFNHEKPPFDDVRVRRALAISVDRDFMVANVLSPGYTPAYSLVPPTISNYGDNRPKFYWKGFDRATRLKEAKSLLLQAGFGPENPLTFEFIFRSSGDSPRVAVLAEAQWNEIAPWVKAKVSSQEVKVLYARLRRGDFEVADAAWRSDVDDPMGFLELFESGPWSQNWSRYRSPKLDGLLKAAEEEPDLKKRAERLASAEKLLVDDVAVSPMWYGSSGDLVTPEINGWSENSVDIHRSRWMCRASKSGD